MLELQSGCLKYLYSGHDNNHPEVLDYGLYKYNSDDWQDLFISFEQQLLKIINNKLPPVKQLETYLIPPYEAVIPFRISDMNLQNKSQPDSWIWELNNYLTSDQAGYAAELNPATSAKGLSLIEKTGLALRKQHLAAITTSLKRNSMFLAGIFLPQVIFKSIINEMLSSQSAMFLIYKDKSSYSLLANLSAAYPVLKKFHFQNAMETDKDSLIKLIENISLSQFSTQDSQPPPIYTFANNFDILEIEFIEKQLNCTVNIAPLKQTNEMELCSSTSDYFLLYNAHKKIGELNFIN